MASYTAVVKRLGLWILRGILAAILVAAVIELASAGLNLRRWAWDFTQDIRFDSDMQRNFLYGSRAATEGYFNIYENVYAESDPGDYNIDYPPLRLLTFDLWIQALKHEHRDVTDWSPNYEFNAPLLGFNTFMESASTIAVFLIIRRWTRRPHLRKGGLIDNLEAGASCGNWESWTRAAFGALLVWFSPGGLADGHGWATYDVWIPPFFLWTILLVSYECWLSAGIALGIGAMFKGQMLLAAPICLLWPLLAGQPIRALRILVGFTLATATVAAPFILSNEIDRQTGVRALHTHAIAWIVCVAIAAALPQLWRLPQLASLSKIVRRFILVGLFELAAMLVLWPVVLPGNHSLWPIMVFGVGVYLAAAWFVRGRWFALLTIGATAAAVFASMALFENSPAWWTVGFRYGSERFFHLVQGPNANLPALLADRFNWGELTDIALTIPAHLIGHWPAEAVDLTNRQFLVGLYFLGLALCSIAAAVHWRRRDRRFLVAVTTVWLMFYCLLPQMIGRYLLFGSTVGAITIAESFGLGLLAFFLSIVAAICTLQAMCRTFDGWGSSENGNIWQQLASFFQRTTPGIAWAVLLAAGVFLTVSLNFKRRPTRLAASAASRPEGTELPATAQTTIDALPHDPVHV